MKCVVMVMCAVAALAVSASAQVALFCGQPANASISAALERDFYAVGASAGDVVSIRLHAALSKPGFNNIAASLELYNPAGQRLATQTGTAPTIETTLTAAGVYNVVVQASDAVATGTYSLVLQKLNAPCQTAELACGQVFATTLGARNEIDAFAFDGVAGTVITLRLHSSLSSAGFTSIAAVVESIAPGGLRTVSRTAPVVAVEVPITTTGRHYVLLSAADRVATGTYSLIFQKLNEPCGASVLACGQTVSTTIGERVETDAYRITAESGAISFRMTSALRSGGFNNIAATLELYDAGGRQLVTRSGTTFLMDATLPAAGTYHLLVGASDRLATGTYSVLWEFPTRPCAPATFTFQVSPLSLSFSAAAGSPSQVPLQVSLGSNLPGLPWQATVRTAAGTNWLRVTPASGQAPAVLQVTADATNLTAGSHQGTIELSAPGGTPASVAIAVNFNVTAASPPRLSVDPSSLAFQLVSGGSTPARTIRIGNAGAGGLVWTAQAATVTGNWLAVAPPAGPPRAGATAPPQISV